jgi:hypothetical protein
MVGEFTLYQVIGPKENKIRIRQLQSQKIMLPLAGRGCEHGKSHHLGKTLLNLFGRLKQVVCQTFLVVVVATEVSVAARAFFIRGPSQTSPSGTNQYHS